MARGFTNASSQYLRNSSYTPYTSGAVTLACWAYPTDDAVVASMLYLCNVANKHCVGLDIAGTVANDPFRAIHRGNGASSYASQINNPTFNAWSHFAGVFASTTSAIAYLNGTAGAENTTDCGARTIAETVIGANFRDDFTSGVNFMSGNVAEAAVWLAALTPAEIALLATGVSPMLVRPDNLEFYAPLLGQTTTSNENDRIGASVLTQTNSPTVQPHPRVFYPRRRQFRYGVTAAGGGGTTIKRFTLLGVGA